MFPELCGTRAVLRPSVAGRRAKCVPPYKPVNLPPCEPLPPECRLNALLHKITATLKLAALLG